MADLSVFHELARALTSSLELEAILASIMRQIQRFFGPALSAVLLTSEEGQDIHYALVDSPSADGPLPARIGYARSMAKWVAQNGKSLILPEVDEVTRLKFDLDSGIGFEVRSAICIPLRSRLRTLGVIQILNPVTETFTDYSASYLLVLCDFAAIAIENARAIEKVQELTITDECTGLYNLRHFQSTLQGEIARCARLDTQMSLIFLDLDHFKLVNDQYGHQVGNRLLAEVGALIKSQIRSIDIPFRYGGDEFAVLLPGTGKRKAAAVSERLLSKLRKTRHPVSPSLSLNIGASLGVSSWPEDGTTAQEILRVADARMYAVKNSTRNGVGFLDNPDSLDRPA